MRGFGTAANRAMGLITKNKRPRQLTFPFGDWLFEFSLSDFHVRRLDWCVVFGVCWQNDGSFIVREGVLRLLTPH
jgi:hypothetical protein